MKIKFNIGNDKFCCTFSLFLILEVKFGGSKIEFGSDADNPDPRLHVRGTIGNGLEARIDRALYYEIVEMALAEDADNPAIWSNGTRFPLVDG